MNMGLKFNWQRVTETHKRLKASGFKSDSKLTFVLILSDGTTRKQHVLFERFLDFFWDLSESKHLSARTLFVQDTNGKILYKYNQVTNGNEEIPSGGNPQVVLGWKNLSQAERDTYLKLLIAQIESE
jgi:hypothetical protein